MRREPQPVPNGPPGVQADVIRYLLDQMDEAERRSLEERLISTPEFSEIIASIEDDLIMRYVRGDLDGGLVSRFNEVYMSSPAKLARVEKARALRQALREVSAERKPGPARSLRVRFSIAAAAAAVLITAVVWQVGHRGPGYHGTEPGDPSYESSASFSLEPGITRSGEGVQITLPPGVHEVHLELDVPKAAAVNTYQVVLGTAEHPGEWKGVAAPRDGHLVAIVPGKVLSAGDYTLELQKGGEEVMTFYFRVAK